MDIRRVMVADECDSSCVDLLKKHGVKVDCIYKLPKDQLIEKIKDYDGLIVRSETKVVAEVIEAAKNLKVIGRAGVGIDNIDLKAASAKNIVVVNAPTGNAISACELTCSLITNLARSVSAANISMKQGKWDRKKYGATGHELYGKTLAIIGLGRIGREVAHRMQAWGMKTIGFDPLVSAEEAKKFNVEWLSLEEIWPKADYITVHVPLIPATKHMVNSAVLSRCKKGVRIVNVARGGIIEEAALLGALKSGQCAGAAFDVFEQEPPNHPITLELIQHENFVATPHLGASTAEAQVRVAVEISEQFLALKGNVPEYNSVPGVVNRDVMNKVLGK